MSWDPQWSVETWLDELGLGVYTERFLDNGYNLQELCANLKEEDLAAIGVEGGSDRKRIFAQSEALRKDAMARFKSKRSVGSAGSTDQSGSMDSRGSFPGYSEPWEGVVDRAEPKHLYTDVWVGDSDALGNAAAALLNGQIVADPPSETKKRQSTEKLKGGTFPPVAPGKPQRLKKAWPPTSPSQPLSPAPPPLHSLPPAPATAGGLTKLQLKLKVLEELQVDRIILSEAPYLKEDGTFDQDKLAELAYAYSGRFQLSPSQVLPVIVNICRGTSQIEMKKISVEETDASNQLLPVHRTVKLSSSDLYEEPVDKTDDIFHMPSQPKEASPGSKLKAFSLPSKGKEGIYQEPADTLLGLKKTTTPPQKPSNKIGSKGSNSSLRTLNPERSPEEQRHLSVHSSPHSSPLPSPIPSPSNSPQHSQKRFGLFKRKEKKATRSRSVKEIDLNRAKTGQAVLFPADGKKQKKCSSSEDLLHAVNNNKSSSLSSSSSKPLLLQESARASFPIVSPIGSLPNGDGIPPPLPPYRRTISVSSSSTSASETSPNLPKKGGILRFSKRWDTTQAKAKKEQKIRKKKKNSSKKSLASSDNELHKVEADTDHEDNSQQCMKTSQSHDNLCNFKPPIDQSTLPQETKQTHKKMGIFGRFRKKQTMKKGKSGMEGGRVKFGGGEMAEEGEGLPHSGGITSSLSMPDIAYAAVCRRPKDTLPSSSGYHYVTSTVNNPQVVDGDRLLPDGQSFHLLEPSPTTSPQTSPVMQRRITQTSQSSRKELHITIRQGDGEGGEGGEEGEDMSWYPLSPSQVLQCSVQSYESGVFSHDSPSNFNELATSRTSRDHLGSLESPGSVFSNDSPFSPLIARPASRESIRSQKGPPPPLKPKPQDMSSTERRGVSPGVTAGVKSEERENTERGGRGGGGGGGGRVSEGAIPPKKPPRPLRGSVKRLEEIVGNRQEEKEDDEQRGEGGAEGVGGGIGIRNESAIPPKKPPRPLRGSVKRLEDIAKNTHTEKGDKKEGGGGGGRSTDVSPPPKPARRNRTMKPDKPDRADLRKLQTMPSSSSSSFTEELQGNQAHSPLTFHGKRHGSSDSQSRRAPTRVHGPIPKPRSFGSHSDLKESKSPPPSLDERIARKLSDEGIDLTISPYSNIWGHGEVPFALLSRYANELDHPVDSIALIVDDIRGRQLKKLSREYTPIKRVDSAKHTEMSKESLESFLVSIGLPMCLSELHSKGYTSLPHLLELTDAKLSTFNFKSNHHKRLLDNIHKL